MQKKWLVSLAAAAGMLILILDSRTALAGASEGVRLCIQTVIPSLFPFLFLSGTFSGSCPWTGSPGRLIGRIFGIPKGMEYILVPMLLGGYPVGAQCVYEASARGTISKRNAERMLAYCSNCGPAFLFGMLAAFFPGMKLLWLLWGITLSGIWAAAFVFSVPGAAGDAERAGAPFGIEKAIWAMLKICGWVILFRVLIGFLGKWVLWRAKPEMHVLWAGVLELTNGCCMLGSIMDERIRFLLCSVLLSFGGICVLFQTVSVCPGLSIRYYLAGKLLQAGTSAVIAAAIAFRLWVPVFLWAGVLLLLRLKEKTVEIPKKVMYNSPTNRQEAEYAVSKEN